MVQTQTSLILIASTDKRCHANSAAKIISTDKRGYADSRNPALIEEPITQDTLNSKRQELETQRDQSNEEKRNSNREMNNNMSEFFGYSRKILEIESVRHEGLTEEKEEESSSRSRLLESFQANLEEEESDIYEGNNVGNDDIYVQLRQTEIDKERVRILAEFTKFRKDLNDKNSTIEGNDVDIDADEDYDNLLAKTEQAEKAVLESCDKHLANIQKVIEIEAQIRSLEDEVDNGPAPGNVGVNTAGNNEGPANSGGSQAGNNAGSLLDDYANPSLEQPSHMDSDD